MATGGASTRKDEDFRHTCGLCMEPYRGRTPKILPCFHTFCLPCLTTLQASVAIATPGNPPEDDGRQPEGEEQQSETNRDDNEKKTPETSDSKEKPDDVTFSSNDVSTSGQEPRKAVLLCPMCRAPVPVPEGGVAHLQSNFYVDHEKSGDKAPPPVLCDMCDEGNQQRAAHVCHQCSLRMCRECRRCHDRLMRSHHVTSLGLGQPSVARSQKKGVCLVHQDQALCFHCQQCDVSICLHCKLTSHEGHVTLDLAIAAAQAKKEVTSLVASAQEQLQVMESSLLRVERDERDLTRHKQDVTQQIHARYDVIMASIQRSRDELLDEVSAKEERPRSQLRAQKTAATVTKETLSALVSRAARVSGSDPDAVRVRKELQAALLSEDRLDQHRQQADRQQSLWSWRYDVTDVSLVQQDVVGACMGRVVEGGEDDVTRPLSVTQLADKLDRLVTRLDITEADVKKTTSALSSEITAMKKSEADTKKTTSALSSEITAMKKSEADTKKTTSALSNEITAMKKSEADTKKTTSALSNEITAMKKSEADTKKSTSALSNEITAMKKSEADTKKTTSALSNEITAMKKSEADTKKTTSALSNEITAMKKSEADTKKTTSALADEVTTLNKTTSSLKRTVAQAGKAIAFHAMDIDEAKTKEDETIVFSTVKVNEGSCYDDTTGVFTTSVPGTYVFTATVESVNEDNSVWAHIMVDDTEYAFLRGSFTSTGSSSMSLPLGVGQRVWVKARCDGDQYYNDGMAFTGALVTPQLDSK